MQMSLNWLNIACVYSHFYSKVSESCKCFQNMHAVDRCHWMSPNRLHPCPFWSRKLSFKALQLGLTMTQQRQKSSQKQWFRHLNVTPPILKAQGSPTEQNVYSLSTVSLATPYISKKQSASQAHGQSECVETDMDIIGTRECIVSRGIYCIPKCQTKCDSFQS